MNKATPISQVLLCIPKAFQDEIVTESGVKFYFDGSYEKNFSATVTATIAALPLKVSPEHKALFDQLNIGDEVSISYRIVYDLTFGNDNLNYISTLDDNPHRKEFINGKGDIIRIYALPPRRGIAEKIWIGVQQNKYGDVLSGKQGTESEVDRWLAQFPIGKTDNYRFNNFFSHDGNDYWKCDIEEIFAKKVNGHLVAVGNRILCKPIDEEVPAEVLQNIRHNDSVKIRYTDRGRVISSANKNFRKDQIVSFDPQKVERYEFFGKSYYLIREDLINGIWSKN